MEVLALAIGFLSLFIGPLGVPGFLLSLLAFVGIRQTAFATLESATAVATTRPLETEVTRVDEGEADVERED